MRLRNTEDLGLYLRERRRAGGVTQVEVADRAGVSRRWLSDLEAGKPTAEVGLVFKVMSALNLVVDVRAEPEPEIDLDAYLDSLGGGPHEP